MVYEPAVTTPTHTSEIRLATSTNLLSAGRDVYAYFNNDIGGHAVKNAMTLRALLEMRQRKAA